jgi:hypothetical protein
MPESRSEFFVQAKQLPDEAAAMVDLGALFRKVNKMARKHETIHDLQKRLRTPSKEPQRPGR